MYSVNQNHRLIYSFFFCGLTSVRGYPLSEYQCNPVCGPLLVLWSPRHVTDALTVVLEYASLITIFVITKKKKVCLL